MRIRSSGSFYDEPSTLRRRTALEGDAARVDDREEGEPAGAADVAPIDTAAEPAFPSAAVDDA